MSASVGGGRDEDRAGEGEDMGAAWPLLRVEHELLGAEFSLDEGLDAWVPAAYGDSRAERETLAAGVGIADLSGLLSLLVAGEDGAALVQAACARVPLAVGECGFSAVLTGDGALASVPLVARTGDAEYVLWDGSARAGMLDAWLRFVAGIEQEGSAPFARAAVDDVSESLVPLLVAGPHASDVLRDYTDELPAAGEVSSVLLDEIRCLVAGLPEALGAGWLVLVGPAYARVIWRSLLSFANVEPVGWRALGAWALERLPWANALRDATRVLPAGADLRDWGLARAGDDFIGARGL